MISKLVGTTSLTYLALFPIHVIRANTIITTDRGDTGIPLLARR